jgi:hypothetical protein
MMIKLEYDFQISGPYINQETAYLLSIKVKLGNMYAYVPIPLKCFTTGDFSCYTRDLEKVKLALIAGSDSKEEPILKTTE